MPRTPPPSPDLPPELVAALAAMDIDELRAATGQVLDLASARAARLVQSQRVSRRRPRASAPFSVTVRVDLRDTRPAVWRRLELPSTLRLDELHEVLQVLYGWSDSHLHRFTQGSSVWDRDAEVFLCPYDVQDAEDEGVATSDVRLDEVLAEPGDVLRYVYDYGDEWSLVLKVEQVGGAVERPRCTGGRGSAPPEDSGGPWDWDGSAGPPFDPQQVDLELADQGRDQALPAELRELVRVVALTEAEPLLRALLADAELVGGRESVDETEAADAVRSYTWLLHRVGDGIALTQAGWLPPAVVLQTMTDLGFDQDHIGKGNREDLTWPVQRLRSSAQRLGLLRVSKGRLLRTKAGLALVDDPVRLWRHVAQRAAGSPRDPFARTATALVLLSVAAGRSRTSAELGPVLGAAGWRTAHGDAPEGWGVWRVADLAVDVLEVVGAFAEDDGGLRGPPTQAARALARVALNATAG